MLACEVGDSTGQLTAFFYGRTQITGVEPGIRIRLHGTIGIGADSRGNDQPAATAELRREALDRRSAS